MRKRLCKLLGFRDHRETVISPNRDNIRFTVIECDKKLNCFDWLVGILKRVNAPQTIVFCHTVNDTECQRIIEKYETVFVGEGKLNAQQVKLHISKEVKPVVQPQRRIPYHLRKEVSKELKKLVDEDIIEEACDQPTPWISPIVCTPKKDGGTRICVDMRAANQAIKRERHVMPSLSDFKAEMNGSKYFSKIDLKQAYHQLELTEESRYITTFSTHEGLFRYKRLNYGTNSAAEIFQNILNAI